MDSTQNAYSKRTIRVRHFLEDFHAGAGDAELMEKYHLTPDGIERFYNMLAERGIISLEDRPARLDDEIVPDDPELAQDTLNEEFTCGSCGEVQAAAFDMCPVCGNTSPDSTESVPEDAPTLPEPPAHYSVLPESTPSIPEDTLTFSPTPAVEDDVEPQLPEMESFEDLDMIEGYAQSVALETSESPDSSDLTSYIEGFETEEDKSYAYDEGTAEESEFAIPFETELPEASVYYEDEPSIEISESQDLVCDHCEEVLEPETRAPYERRPALLSLAVAGGALLLSFLFAVSLHFFNGYSFARLLVVYSVILWFLCGSVFMGIGAFMLLAKEKIFWCKECRRMYPRA